MNSSSRDAGIPLLTEVIDLAPQETDPDFGQQEPAVHTQADQQQQHQQSPDQAQFAGRPDLEHATRSDSGHAIEGQTPPATLAPASVEELEARAIASMGRQDWARLERALRERILRQLLARVDNTLEQHVRDSLADVLQGAVSTLANDIRGGLHQSLEEMIVRAVSQEITRLRSTQN